MGQIKILGECMLLSWQCSPKGNGQKTPCGAVPASEESRGPSGLAFGVPFKNLSALFRPSLVRGRLGLLELGTGRFTRMCP